MDPRKRFAETVSLHRELRIRLTSSMQEALALPLDLPNRTGIRDVIRLYADSLSTLDRLHDPELPPTAPGLRGIFLQAKQDSGDVFLGAVEDIFESHTGVIKAMMTGMYGAASELRHEYQVVQPQIDRFLERFFLTHIGLRFRLSHHARLLRAAAEPGFVGALALGCRPAEVARLAARDSRAACIYELGQAPAIVVREVAAEAGGPPMVCTHVPSALRYALNEVFKNACRAVAERHGDGFDDDLPPIQCTISSGPAGITLLVSDMGGGIPDDELEKVWKFMYTNYESRSSTAPCGPAGGTPLAGYGVGLALSRLYLRYFGGDLSTESRPGTGTEVRLHLRDVRRRFELLPGALPQLQPWLWPPMVPGRELHGDRRESASCLGRQ